MLSGGTPFEPLAFLHRIAPAFFSRRPFSERPWRGVRVATRLLSGQRRASGEATGAAASRD